MFSFYTRIVEKNQAFPYCTLNRAAYFGTMENRYSTLKALFVLAKEEAAPASHFYSFYQVQQQEAHSMETVIGHLDALEKENLVRLRLEDGLYVALTPKGLEKISSLSMLHLL